MKKINSKKSIMIKLHNQKKIMKVTFKNYKAEWKALWAEKQTNIKDQLKTLKDILELIVRKQKKWKHIIMKDS